MAILFGGSRVNGASAPATSLRVQTALIGQPIPIVHGKNRIAGNLIWYGGFSSTGGGGGKGAVASAVGKGQSQTTYSADVEIGLCEGPILNIDAVWSGQAIYTMAKLALTSFLGAVGQAAWSFLTAKFPQYALGYSSLAAVGAAPLNLGGSPTMPNLNFEVVGSVSGAVQETYTIASGSGYAFTPTNWNLSNSVVEQVTIPATGPYTYQAQNPYAQTLPLVLKSGGNILGSGIPGSASQGVIDINGRVFTRVSSGPTTGQYTIASNAQGYVYTFSAADAGLQVTVIDLAVSPGVLCSGVWFSQVLGTPTTGQFSISVQPSAFGKYQFAAADAGKTVTIYDVLDADPSASLTDYLTNARYGCGLPTVNMGNLSALQNFAYAAGMFISPALVASQAASDYLNDFSTGLCGEFVWSTGLLTFVPYCDTTITGYGKTYTAPTTALYSLTDDTVMKNEGTASVGASAFTSVDPIVGNRTPQYNAYNDVKVEYLDRGNSYNPAIAEAQDDAAIALYSWRPADTKSLHFFCYESAAMNAAQLQLGRQQVRNQYAITVPWYFILLDPMDLIAITDAALGLENQLVRIREITENQNDLTLTLIVEEYVPGSGTAPLAASQPVVGYVAQLDTTAAAVN